MRRIRMSLILVCSILSMLFINVSHAQFIFEDLSTAREKIVFPELTDAEKLVLAEQTKIIFQGLYPHRFQKQNFYDDVPDPAVAVQAVIDNIDNLSVTELETQLSRIFTSQRDLHTSFLFPEPYSNFTSFLPLTFKRVESHQNFFEVRIDSISDGSFPEEQREPKLGDRVVAYNGVPIEQAVGDNVSAAAGANEFAGFSRGLTYLTFRPHTNSLLPEEDEVTLTLQSSNAGSDDILSETYDITLPWITFTPAPVANTEQSILSEERRKQNANGESSKSEDLTQKLFNEFRSENEMMSVVGFPENPSNEPSLTWGVIENNNGRFGYLRLSSFAPSDLVIEEIRRLIYEEFDGTRGLIFDVRDNPGGSAAVAASITQLFTRNDAVVTQARLLNTSENREFYSATSDSLPQATEALNDVLGLDDSHTAPFDFFLTQNDANTLGQLYNAPVVVFANSSSYSGGDFFACQMQDSNAALLAGEEPLTGGGGANSVTHSNAIVTAPNLFSPLPATHDMTFASAQAIRTGVNQGEFIEDFACRADVVVSPRESDVIDGGASQVERITSMLGRASQLPEFRASVRAPSNDVFLSVNAGEQLDFPLAVENTAKARVSINGELVEEVVSERPVGDSTLPITLSSNVFENGFFNELLIEGLDDAGNRLWNLKRRVFLFGERVAVDADGFEIDFSDATSIAPFATLTFGGSSVEDGWSLAGSALQLGYNPSYAPNVVSDAFLSLDLSAVETAQLSLDLEFDIVPEGFDSIQINLTDEQGNVTNLFQGSGVQELETFDFDLSRVAGQSDVLLSIRFISDAVNEAQGVRVRRVEVR